MPPRTKFTELKKVLETLHGPQGCLWDKKQTHKSLIKYLKEEAREFIATVKNNKYAHMQEELGDLLLQVMFHAQIASKKGKFTIEDVIEGLIRKLKRRHPHVFGGLKVKSVEEIKANWQKIKAQEKAGGKNTSI